MKTIKLAEALLRRKELQQKLDVLSRVQRENIFQTVFRRKQVTESLDDVMAEVPRVSAAQVTAAYDWTAKALRHIDAVIQQANWVTEVSVQDETMADYSEPDNLKTTTIPMVQK